MTKKTVKTEDAAGFQPMQQVMDTLKSVQDKIQVPDAARDFVKRSAETLTTRAGDVQSGATAATVSVEKALGSVVATGGEISRGLIEAGHANVTMTLGAVAKIAEAKSASEAFQIYVDYVREYGRTNVARVQGAYEAVRVSAMDGAQSLQGEVAKFMPWMKKAA